MLHSQSVHSRQYSTAHARRVLDNKGYKHTLIICDTYCFSMASLLTRTRLDVTLLRTLHVLFSAPSVLLYILPSQSPKTNVAPLIATEDVLWVETQWYKFHRDVVVISKNYTYFLFHFWRFSNANDNY
jgi:hypothetical protein